MSLGARSAWPSLRLRRFGVQAMAKSAVNAGEVCSGVAHVAMSAGRSGEERGETDVGGAAEALPFC